MSLAQHVTQAEGFDYNHTTSPNQFQSSSDRDTASGSLDQFSPPGKPEWRRMNFAPAESVCEEPHTAAYKVSFRKRCVQVATGVVACWLSAGIIFGFAALKPVLVDEGVYRNLCDPLDGRPFVDYVDNHEIPCIEQDMRLNLFFIIGSVTANVSSLLAGTALDRYGRRTCWVVACLSLTVGSLLMGVSFAIPEFDGYIVGNVFLSFGGTFIFIPSFQLANAFPKCSGVIIALVTGAFDASAAVFLIYRVVYQATEGKFSIGMFFFSYIIVPALIIIVEFAYMPPRSYHTVAELEQKIDRARDNTRDVHESDEDIHDAGELARVRSARADRRMARLDRIEDVAGDTEHREGQMEIEKERHRVSGVWGVLHGVPAHKQVLSPWFMLILFLTALQMLRMNYFIATIGSQYRYMLGSESLSTAINHFFDIALPIGGIASTPFVGLLLNSLSVSMIFCLLTLFTAAFGILNCLPYAWSGYATVVIFVIFRPLYYSSVSDYAIKVFGFDTFGTIYGIIVCISGILNLTQSGLDALTHLTLNGDPIPINIALATAGTILSATLAIFVTVKGRMFVAGERLGHEVNNERRRLLSAGQEGYSTI